MATYIMLGTLTDEGRKTVKQNPIRNKEVNSEIESIGAKVLVQYVVLGPYDYVNVVKVKDNQSIWLARNGLVSDHAGDQYQPVYLEFEIVR